MRHGLTKSVASGQSRVGAKVGELIIDLNLAYASLLWEQNERKPYELADVRIPGDMVEFLEGGDASMDAARQALEFAQEREADLLAPLGERVFFSESEIEWLAPVPRPGKIIIVVMNNWEMYPDRSEKPPYFQWALKASNTVIGHMGTIRIPAIGAHPEIELGVVIGKWVSRVPREQADSVIAGYTIFNDVSADTAMDHYSFTTHGVDPETGEEREVTILGSLANSKSRDTFSPMGPWLVTRDEVQDPTNLKMVSKSNGEVIQEGSTKDLIFGPAEIIAFISNFLTLEPGDVISTGTVGWTTAKEDGYGAAQWARRSFKGVLELEIEGLGTLRNAVVGPG